MHSFLYYYLIFINCTAFVVYGADKAFAKLHSGELIVEDTFGHQSVKLPAGDAIVYPGTSLHRVNPVTRGARYGSFFWTHSLVASDEQRRILFDLDQQIQQLTVRHPGDPSLGPLSGTYHNLLRMWSQA